MTCLRFSSQQTFSGSGSNVRVQVLEVVTCQCRSSRAELLCKEDFLNDFENSKENSCVGLSFLKCCRLQKKTATHKLCEIFLCRKPVLLLMMTGSGTIVHMMHTNSILGPQWDIYAETYLNMSEKIKDFKCYVVSFNKGFVTVTTSAL